METWIDGELYDAPQVFKQVPGSDLEPGWYAVRQLYAANGAYPYGPCDGPHKTKREAERAARLIGKTAVPAWWRP